MTLDDAKKIARIVGCADGGCAHCVSDLVALLDEAFPEFVWETGKYVAPADENNWQGRIEVYVKEKGLEGSEEESKTNDQRN